MRNETTTLRRPKTWITVALALGHAVIIAALALPSQPAPARTPSTAAPSILDCLQSDSPAPK